MTRFGAASPRMLGRRLTVIAVTLALAGLVAGCSDDEPTATAGSKRSVESRRSGSSGSGATGESGSTEDAPTPAEAAAEALEAAKAASNKPSGTAGVPAPNDDDGARNLASVDPLTGPQAQDTSGSMAGDPMTSPTPTFPEPGRPDVEGLLPLDGCDDISTPFYRAVSSLSPNSSASTILAGVKDLATVASLAQAPIAAAVQTLLTIAQGAAADAARAKEFTDPAFQGAVKSVHVYLGDACGR